MQIWIWGVWILQVCKVRKVDTSCFHANALKHTHPSVVRSKDVRSVSFKKRTDWFNKLVTVERIYSTHSGVLRVTQKKNVKSWSSMVKIECIWSLNEKTVMRGCASHNLCPKMHRLKSHRRRKWSAFRLTSATAQVRASCSWWRRRSLWSCSLQWWRRQHHGSVFLLICTWCSNQLRN